MRELKKPSVLQLRHNNREGFVYAYEVDEMNKYLSELDGMIAELKDDCAYWKMSEGNAVNAMHETEEYAMQLYNELRHHKFKRCLAMAMWCEFYADSLRVKRNQCRYDEAEIAETYYIRCCRYRRWCKVWMELAEKFKPNNSTVQ